MRSIVVKQTAAEILNGIDDKDFLDAQFKRSEIEDRAAFDKAVKDQVATLEANIKRAASNAVFADKDIKKDATEFEPLRARRLKADEGGVLSGFRPGQEYVVFLCAGDTTVVESTPAKLGGGGPSRRKTATLRSVYDPVEPKPKVAPKRTTRPKPTFKLPEPKAEEDSKEASKTKKKAVRRKRPTKDSSES